MRCVRNRSLRICDYKNSRLEGLDPSPSPLPLSPSPFLPPTALFEGPGDVCPGVAQGFDVLGAVEGLIGGMCSMTCSLLLPVLLYTTLKWPRLSTRARAALVALIGLSVVVLLLVIAVSVYSMVIPGSTGHNGAAETRATFTRLYRGFPW